MQPNDIVLTKCTGPNLRAVRIIERVTPDGWVRFCGDYILPPEALLTEDYTHIPFGSPAYAGHLKDLLGFLDKRIAKQIPGRNGSYLERLHSIREAANKIDSLVNKLPMTATQKKAADALIAYSERNPFMKAMADMKAGGRYPTPRSWDMAMFGSPTEILSGKKATLAIFDDVIPYNSPGFVSFSNPEQPTPSNKENEMRKDIIVEQTLINGHVLQEMNQSQLMGMIRELECEDNQLSSITTQSAAITAMREKIKQALARVVARLDEVYAA